VRTDGAAVCAEGDGAVRTDGAAAGLAAGAIPQVSQ
jgi:hypothetical protein